MRFTFVTLVITSLLLLPSQALASGAQVIADWRADSSIDGDYTLAELQAADGMIDAQQREYYDWDDAYAAAISRLGNPDAPKPPKRTPVAVPVDSNGNGTIDPEEKQKAAEKTKQLQAKANTPSATPDATDTTPDDEPTTAAASDRSSDDDGGMPMMAIGLIAVLVALLGVGVWRVLAARRSKSTATVAETARITAQPTEPRKPGS